MTRTTHNDNAKENPNSEHCIGDIVPSTEVVLTAYLSGISMQFLTTAVEGQSEALNELYLDVIRKDDKVINFANAKSDIAATIDNRAYRFRVQKITVEKKNEKTVYVVTSHERKLPTNRRNHVRIKYFADAWIQPDANKPAYEAITRDISISGISVLVKRQITCDNGSECSITLAPSGEKEAMMVQLKGKIVRCEYKEEQNETLVCVQFMREYESITGLVARRQREELRRLRDKGST